jgi:hypothetical protein
MLKTSKSGEIPRSAPLTVPVLSPTTFEYTRGQKPRKQRFISLNITSEFNSSYDRDKISISFQVRKLTLRVMSLKQFQSMWGSNFQELNSPVQASATSERDSAAAKRHNIKQEVLGRNNRLLSFNTTRPKILLLLPVCSLPWWWFYWAVAQQW